MRREPTLEAAGSQLYDLIPAGRRGISIDALHLAASDEPATEAEFAALTTVAPDEP